MGDIVDRLREAAASAWNHAILREAADEITRLRADLATASGRIDTLDAIKAQVKSQVEAETRAKVIEEAMALKQRHVTLSGQRYSAVLRAELDALHTDASRAAAKGGV